MSDDKKNILAKRIKFVRLLKEMTQRELAKRAEVSVCVVNFIESGSRYKKVIRLSTINKIAKALELNVEEFVKFLN